MSSPPPFPIKLNPRNGWLGWWPGWSGLTRPEKTRVSVFVAEEADKLPEGARVLDAGAGRRTFENLFKQQRYESCDMPGGFYKQKHDFECYLDSIPKADNTYDAVINTQVLEHVPDPPEVFKELHRVLKPNGVLLLSVPLNAPLHGQPWHFFHFTHYGIFQLAQKTGFEMVSCEKIGGAFWALGKRLRDVFAQWLKQYDPTRARKRGQSLSFCLLMNALLLIPWLVLYPVSAFVIRPLCYWLDLTDIEKSYTNGYTVVLRKP